MPYTAKNWHAILKHHFFRDLTLRLLENLKIGQIQSPVSSHRPRNKTLVVVVKNQAKVDIKMF